MTDDLWMQLIGVIEPLRSKIGQDTDGSGWRALCAQLSEVIAMHGWTELNNVCGNAWDSMQAECDGESLSLMVGLNDLMFLSVERGTITVREMTWTL